MFDRSLDFKTYLHHEWVVSTSKQISSHKSRDDDRTLEENLIDATNGCSLQLAVYEYLKENEIDVYHAPDERKEYDLIIRYGDDEFCIDVKGIFKDNSKFFSQTAWEKINVQHLGHLVYYFCFDCTSGEAIYCGWCTHLDFTPSKFNQGAYIPKDKLKIIFD